MQFGDIKLENQKRAYLNQCKFVHFYGLDPIEQGHQSILLHVNFNTTGNYSATQNDIICKLLHALGDVGVQVSGASFDGDKVLVKILCKEFYESVVLELTNQCTPDLIKYCKNYNSPLPCCGPPHLLKRVRTYLLTHDSVIDHSGAGMRCTLY